ncbi:hypothetical protein Dtox_0425 [Desulfofarcimen acetoxidans DSM 771]|jgi:hypothetical protein|uniref:DUF8193 domain-containing protein n=1 Tax=Desulfofarcimen acetoxidans (strain ATCC 49208 / DSM 771 / KCTC 5769 / VKM B-1644 / 5575) TaxID=485916 RepID=C8W510_DESAS|nr:hypothetical protein [Desulfofarcimen acetoxidans]ACV61362.1 hypothetical protein Dtox_0425 [Desulfofarcimen acetoxidans DSM 771]
MKRILSILLITLLITMFLPMTAFAIGDGNVDGGGGMGDGTSTDYWNTGDEGVHLDYFGDVGVETIDT